MSEDPYRWDERVEAWEKVATSPAFLAMRVGELVAVDISERMLDRLDDRAAADGVDNVEPLVADLRRLPLEDECATLVVSNYAFHHLDDPGNELALAEARRILRPGGRLVICDMMFSLSLEPPDRASCGRRCGASLDEGRRGWFAFSAMR